MDGSISTVRPLLSQSRFPRLKHLGLKNSEIQDDIVSAILNSDLLEQLAGKQLDVSENYLSDEMVAQLEASSLNVNTSEQKEDEDEDEEWRYVSVSE